MNSATRPAPRELSGPPVDIVREGETLLVAMSLPGLKAGDFRISLVGDRQLQIEGTVPYRYPVPQEHLAQSERHYGPFARTVDLPLPVDGRGAQVTFRNGLLLVRVAVPRLPIPVQWLPAGG